MISPLKISNGPYILKKNCANPEIKIGKLPAIKNLDTIFLSSGVLTKNWQDKKINIKGNQLDNPIQVKDLSHLSIKGFIFSLCKRQMIGISNAESIKVIFHLSFITLVKFFLIELNELIIRKKIDNEGADGSRKIPKRNIFIDIFEFTKCLYIY